jgi:hypothetical protein
MKKYNKKIKEGKANDKLIHHTHFNKKPEHGW